MFDSLSGKLTAVFDRLRGRGHLSEADVDGVLREIRIALLEADVAIPAVKELLAQVKTQMVGQEVTKSLSPAQVVIKAVHDALIAFLGPEEPLNTKARPPLSYLFVGLQGAGKTTTVAKVARTLKETRSPLLVSLDIYRPAARKQLKILGDSLQVPVFEDGEKPLEILHGGLDFAKKNGIDVILWDTAGRLHIDDAMMEELAEVYAALSPAETLLVADAMMGQEAVRVAQAFHAVTPLTGAILTRVDGDMRGGAALSIRYAAQCPIKFLSVGEAVDKLIPFDPKRLADQILDRGDVIQFVDNVKNMLSKDESDRLEKRFAKGKFDMNDMQLYLDKMQSMGGLQGILQMLPDAKKLASEVAKSGVDPAEAEKVLHRQKALILSMTPKERRNPEILNGSRRRRIAAGAGQSVTDLNRFLKQFEQVQTLTKKFSKGPTRGLMQALMRR